MYRLGRPPADLVFSSFQGGLVRHRGAAEPLILISIEREATRGTQDMILVPKVQVIVDEEWFKEFWTCEL